MRLIYTSLIYLLSPLILFFLYRPKQGKPGYEDRWKEHLGFTPTLKQTNPVWFHAVSVGETLAITPLIQQFCRAHPEIPVLITTTTRTGADQAEKIGHSVEHRYAPLDYPGAISRFIKTVQPQALIIMETELWPNLLHQCHQRQIPVSILNARLSEQSCQRYQRIRGFFRHMMQGVHTVLCQHQDDADRFRRLGVRSDQLAVTGSIKFDIRLNQQQIEIGAEWKAQLNQRPVWIAASTHKGEDEKIILAHQQLRKEVPEALLILVPRHPERFDAVAALVKQNNLSLIRRSQNQAIQPSTQVYLGDSMGEMASYFQMADIAWMGGSFVPVGGHNLLEPAALAKPTLIGPHFYNFSDITRQLVTKQACHVVQDEHELATELLSLFRDDGLRQSMGMAGFDVVTANQGALEKSLKAIEASIR